MSDISVVVTGVGPVSAIGGGRNEFWDALTAGRHHNHLYIFRPW